jgi:hypothetical protein
MPASVQLQGILHVDPLAACTQSVVQRTVPRMHSIRTVPSRRKYNLRTSRYAQDYYCNFPTLNVVNPRVWFKTSPWIIDLYLVLTPRRSA